MTLKLYMTPGSCSTGIHILMEMLELPFEAHVLNLPAGQHREPAYLALNPKGTIPTLVLDDGQTLTEFQAIAVWLARRWPRAGLLPDDPLGAARAIEWMEDAVNHVHGQCFTRVFTPERWLPPETPDADRAGALVRLQAQGREMATRAFERIAPRLPAQGFVLGERFSIADAALFYPEFWADKTGLALPAPCEAHYRRVRALPAVQRVLAEEGYR